MKHKMSTKALSVFLSFLMVMSACFVAFPALSETFGLKADAAVGNVTAEHKTALQNALTAYSNVAGDADKAANAKLHVAEALLPVVQDLAFSPSSWPSASISHGSWPWSDWEHSETEGDSTAPFMGDLRNAVKGYCSNNTQKSLIDELIPYFGGDVSNETYTPQNKHWRVNFGDAWEVGNDGTSYSDYYELGAIADPVASVSRTVKQALYDYTLQTLSTIPDSIRTNYSITYQTELHHGGAEKRYATAKRYTIYEFYYFDNDPTASSSNSSIKDYRNDLVTFFNRFTTARVGEDPFAVYADEAEAQAAVNANTAAWNAVFGSGRWNKNLTSDQNIINYFGGQVTTIAGDTVGATGFYNAVEKYMAACVDAVNYYKAKPYAEYIVENGTGEGVLDLAKLDALDLSYMSRDVAYFLYGQLNTKRNGIEDIFTDKTTKGYLKLGTVDGYYNNDSAVVPIGANYVITLLEDYYEYYDLKKLREQTIDPTIETMTREEYRDLTAYTDEEIDILYSTVGSWIDTLNSGTYSQKVINRVFPDGYQYITDYYNELQYEVTRRDFHSELQPIMSHFAPLLNSNMKSFTPAQLFARINEDKAIYQGATWLPEGAEEGTDPYRGYITVYEAYKPNTLIREDFLELLNTFNEDVQAYMKALHQALADDLVAKVTDAMNYTEAGNAEITLNNFSLIKTSVERVRNDTINITETVDGQEQTRTVLVHDWLLNEAKMKAQSANDGEGHLTGAFNDITFGGIFNVNVVMNNGATYTFASAYDIIMNGDFMQRYEAFKETGGLNKWNQLHFYNTAGVMTADSAVAGANEVNQVKYSTSSAIINRLPYADDLGRGNDTLANDTYTVTRDKLNNLITQLDTFLQSGDFVSILSTLIDSDMLEGVNLSEYVMKMLGEKLFTDEIMNKLTKLIFPTLTAELEELWRELDGKGEWYASVYTVDGGKTIYYIANQLRIAAYPSQIKNVFSSIPQLSQVAARMNQATYNRGDFYRADEWTSLMNEEGNLDFVWGIDAVEKGENETYEAWFARRAGAFKVALTGVLNCLRDIAFALFANQTYEAENVTDVVRLKVLAIFSGKPNLEDFKIQGINGYSRVIVPLLEALGCASEDIIPSGEVNNRIYQQHRDSASGLVDAIIDPIVNLVLNQVAAAPLATVLNLLPNIMYFLAFGTLDELVRTLNIKARGKVAFFELKTIINVLGAFIDVPVSTDGDWVVINILHVMGKNSVNELIEKVDITDLNDIVRFVIDMALPKMSGMEVPIIDVGSVLSRTWLNRTAASKALNASNNATTRIQFTADNADMFYDLLSWVGKAFQNESFIGQLMSIILSSNERQEGIIEEILTGVRDAGPAAFVCALVELFQPKVRTGLGTSAYNGTTYKVADYVWYTSDKSAVEDMNSKPISSYLYLNYGNDWTYVKANTFIENADIIISKLLESQLKEKEVNSFGELLQSWISLAWSNEAITMVMRLLVKVGGALDSDLLKYIISRFTENGMDLTQWNKYWGFLYADAVTEEVDDGEGNVTTTYPAGEKDLYEWIDLYHQEKAVVFDVANYINDYFAAVGGMPEGLTFDPEALSFTYNASGSDDNLLRRFSVRVATGEERTVDEAAEGKNNRFIWSFDNVELQDGDRAAFEDMLGNVLAGMMPAIDVFLSGEAGTLFLQPNGTSLLTVVGSNGYDSAIVPLFEAIGVDRNTDPDFEGLLTQAQFDNLGTPQAKVDYLFDAAFGYLENIMSEVSDKLDDQGNPIPQLDEEGNPMVDGEGNPVFVKDYSGFIRRVLTESLPGILYFIQSNGLSIAVRNLIQPLCTVLDDVRPIFNTSNFIYTMLTDTLDSALGLELERDASGNLVDGNPFGLDLKDLSFHAIAGILEKFLSTPEKTFDVTPLVYGLDAICAVNAKITRSQSSVSTDNAGHGNKRLTFIDGKYEYDEATGTFANVNDPANIITILLSLVLDLVLVGDNAEIITELLGGFIGDSPIVDIIPSIVKALTDAGLIDGYMMDPNWFYFDSFYSTDAEHHDYKPTWQVVGTQVLDENDVPVDLTMPMRSIFYLRYAKQGTLSDSTNLWTAEMAKYLDKSFASLVDMIIGLATDYSSLQGLLNGETQEDGTFKEGYWNDGAILFTDKTISDIAKLLREKVVPLVEQFSEILNVFLGFDANYWNETRYPVIEAEDAQVLSNERFAEELGKLFVPLDGGVDAVGGGLLSWLLAGRDLKLFYTYKTNHGNTYVVDSSDEPVDRIVIKGAQGYMRALVPIIEALGFTVPSMEEGDTGVDILVKAVTAILNEVKGIVNGDALAEGETLFDNVLNRLANIIYFINANGLVASIVNLVAPLAPLAMSIAPLLVTEEGEGGEEQLDRDKFINMVDTLIRNAFSEEVDDGEGGTTSVSRLPETFSIANLGLENIFELLKVVLGLDINAAVTMQLPGEGEDAEPVAYNYLTNFYLGAIEGYTSANGRTAFRMHFTDEESRADLITILIYTVFDVIKSGDNDDFFIDLLAPEVENDQGETVKDLAAGAEKFAALKSLLDTTVTTYEGYDWFYFNTTARNLYYGTLDETAIPQALLDYDDLLQAILDAQTDGGYIVPKENNSMAQLIEGYLHYQNDNLWNENTALGVQSKFKEIIQMIVKAVDSDHTYGDDEDAVSAMLGSLFDGLQLYSNKYIYMVGNLLASTMSTLDENLLNLLGVVVEGFDAHAWDEYLNKEVTDDEAKLASGSYVNSDGVTITYVPLVSYEDTAEATAKAQFINDFVGLFEGFGLVLDWLLVGETHAIKLFFTKDDHDALVLGGSNGFKEGLVPLMEALDCEFSMADVEAADTGVKALKLTLNAILNRVDSILHPAEGDVIDQVVGLVPNLLYFINANGLSVTVQNLLRSVTILLESVAKLTGKGDSDINKLFGLDKKGINVYDLSFEGICNLVKGLTGGETAEGEAYDGLDILNATLTYKAGDTYVTKEGPSYLQQFAVGKVITYRSGNGRDLYKMVWRNDAEADPLEKINIFTVLICTLIDVFKYQPNKGFLESILPGDAYSAIVKVLNLALAEFSYEPYDWFYFDGNIKAAAAEDALEPYFNADNSYTYLVPRDESASGYLVYRNFWNTDPETYTEGTAGYIRQNFYDIVNTVIGAIEIGGKKYETLDALITEKWDGLNLYTQYNVNQIALKIKDLLGGLEGVTALVGALLGTENVDWSVYEDESVTKENPQPISRTDFVNGIVDIFALVEPVLNWFLTGSNEPLKFFYDNNGQAAITLAGGDGFMQAIVPILEGFGCDMSDFDTYFGKTVTTETQDNGDGTTSEVEVVSFTNLNGLNAIRYTADKLLGKVDEIVAADNSLEAVVAMLPELVYFINVNGLSVSIRNLLAPVSALIETVVSLVPSVADSLNGFTGVDSLVPLLLTELGKTDTFKDMPLESFTLDNLTMVGIFDIVEKITGIKINEAVTFEDSEGNPRNVYATLALGKVSMYTSANGSTAYRMTPAAYTDNSLNNIDMISILVATIVNTFKLDANRDPLLKLIPENIFNAVISLLNLSKDDNYINYPWLYTIPPEYRELYPQYQNTVITPLGKLSGFTGTAGYDRYWTRDMALYVAENLFDVVNKVLLLLGIKIGDGEISLDSIDALITSFIGGTLYSNENMAKITGLVCNALGSLEENDNAGFIKTVLGVALGIDLDDIMAYKDRTDFGFEDGDRDGFVGVLSEFLSPLNPLLKWLLMDESIGLFYNGKSEDLIVIPGGKGYEYAFVPLIEAIGGENGNIRSFAAYKTDVQNDPNAVIADVLNPLLDIVDSLLEDPLNGLLARLPAIAYFINSKGIYTVVQNIIHPVIAIMSALSELSSDIPDINNLIDTELKKLIDVGLEDLDFQKLFELIIGLLPGNLSNLKPLIVDAIGEFTMGVIVPYRPATLPWAYTMRYSLDGSTGSGSGSVFASPADMITTILRFILKWITMEENQPTIRMFINDQITDEIARRYIHNVYDGLCGFLLQPYGISMMMGMLYYVFFAADIATDKAIDTVQSTGEMWGGVSQALNGLNIAWLAPVITQLNKTYASVNGTSGNEGNTGDNGGNSGNTGDIGGGAKETLNFFQRLIKWFQDLFAKIRAIFVRS